MTRDNIVNARDRLYLLRGQWRAFKMNSHRPALFRCYDCGNHRERLFELSIQVDGMEGSIGGVLLCEACLDDYREGVM